MEQQPPDVPPAPPVPPGTPPPLEGEAPAEDVTAVGPTAPVAGPYAAPPPPPPLAPPLSPMSPLGVDMGGRYAGTGEVDLGGWLTRGWETIKDDLVAFGVATLCAGLLGLLTCGVLAPALTSCGMAMMAFRKILYGQVEIGNFWDGMKRFVPAILALLLLIIPALLIQGVSVGPGLAVAAIDPNNQGLMMAANLWNMGIGTVLQVVFQAAILFVFVHIAARNVGPIEALQASWDVFRRNPLMFCLVTFVYQIVASLGAIACLVGLFVTAPLVMAATVHAYIDHFGLQGVDIET